MSKFTTATKGSTPFVLNAEGAASYNIKDAKLKLITQVFTSFFNESKFYGDNSKALVKATQDMIASGNAAFVANLAVYTRKELHLRSVSHVLAAELAAHAKGFDFTKDAIADVCERADDPYEILGYYMNTYGKPVANSLKKGLAIALGSFEAYALAKYNRTGKKPNLADVIKICHPLARPEYKQIIEGTIAAPDTWEVTLSNTPKAGQKAAWERLVAERKLGYMALLRNLRNLVKADISNLDEALTQLTDPKAVAKSKQLPFRFFSAYQMMVEAQAPNKVLAAIETAMVLSADNFPRLKGKTAIVFDNSGSMYSPISGKGNTQYVDIAALFSALSARFCDDSVVIAFGESAKIVQVNPRSSVFKNLQKIKSSQVGHSTNLHKAFELLSKEHIKVDRVIVYSDLQAYSTENCWGGPAADKTFKGYCATLAPECILHSVDLAGYGTSQFSSTAPNVNLIAGWSEKVFDFMGFFEKGFDSIVKKVEMYKYV